MPLRKPPALTPGLLAANARNARKSTGPRTHRGKMFSSSNGWKGGRPRKSRYPFEVSAGWQPDTSDADFRRWMLAQMRENDPEAYAIWVRCEAGRGSPIEERKELEAGLRANGAPQKVSKQDQNYIDNKGHSRFGLEKQTYRWLQNRGDQRHIFRPLGARKRGLCSRCGTAILAVADTGGTPVPRGHTTERR